MARRAQVPTEPTTILKIMSTPEFALGVADARTRRPYRNGYQGWGIDNQWNYERGRAWASLVPRHVVLKRGGKVTGEAVGWFNRVGQYIL